MKLHVFPASPNARKAMLANALTKLDIPLEIVDFANAAQRSEAFLALNPNGRVPVLEFDDGTTLWESNAIINKMAALAKSDLWPASDVRYDILRWQFWEACHWTPACARFVSKHVFGNDAVDLDAATEEFRRLAAVLDGRLDGRDWLVGAAMTNADISVACVLYLRDACHYPMQGFAHVDRWLGRIEALDAWQALAPQPEPA